MEYRHQEGMSKGFYNNLTWKAHVLRRRSYTNPGTNFAWHIDGYDKLKPYGFPIHGGVDSLSRRVVVENLPLE